MNIYTYITYTNIFIVIVMKGFHSREGERGFDILVNTVIHGHFGTGTGCRKPRGVFILLP